MAVSAIVTVNMGAVSLNPGEYLLYSLYPSVGNPLWYYSCVDRKGIIQVSNNPRSQYSWCLLNGGPGPNPLWVSLDRSLNVADVYVLYLLFTQVQSYRISVTREPSKVVVQDITLTAQFHTDTYPVPLDVTGL
jgi:hypothetical protein